MQAWCLFECEAVEVERAARSSFSKLQVAHEDGGLFTIGVIKDGLASIKSSPARALSSKKSATCTY